MRCRPSSPTYPGPTSSGRRARSASANFAIVVVDASAVVDLLLDRIPADWVAERIRAARRVRAPHLIDVEVASALRRGVAAGDVSAFRAERSLDLFLGLPLRRYRTTPFLHRMWSLRSTLSIHDAAYVALAEALDEPLVTTDAPLSRSHGHRARVEVFPG